MSGSTRVADDADAVKSTLDRLAYDRRMAPLAADCAVFQGRNKSDCTRCVGVRCLLCKTFQPENQNGAKDCLICEKGDGTFKPCPT